MTALDYTEIANNHVFLKSCSNGFFDYSQHVRRDHHDGHGVKLAKQLIGQALCERVERISHEVCEPGEEDSFYVVDLGEVYRQHLRWKLNLPRIKPFYAVKCNPDPKLLELLSALGSGFDCASKSEVDQVLGLGVDPSRIIYAQPCKTSSYLRYVASRGVRKMTFDNSDELHKIARFCPDAELFLRILTDDSSALCRLSMKFGASLDTTDGLLALARELGLNVVGVSFHIGSGASDPGAFVKAVQDSHVVFQQAASHGFCLKTLDVGGGFSSNSSFETMAGVLRAALDEYFPAHTGVNFIAEPGRYFATPAFTLACNVIARRTIGEGSSASYMLYLNDGTYGNFSGIMYDHQTPESKILRCGGRTLYNTPAAEAWDGPGSVEYSIWGPTCDGIDRITESVRFRQVLDVGDWLYFENMGAYSTSCVTAFNGFTNQHDIIYVCSEPCVKVLLGMP
ncbi:hypothetical protein VTH06DRAFT_2189 [Thermothelomyces fergusii]